mgnify:CR=1 FL=1
MNGVEYSETIRTREGERERHKRAQQSKRQVGREREAEQREHSEGIDRSMDGWMAGKIVPRSETSDRTIEWNERSILGSR